MNKRSHEETESGSVDGTAERGTKRKQTMVTADEDDDERQRLLGQLQGLVVCPISLERMRDPVTLMQSGNTYDREHLCQSLLHFPTKDPKSNVEYYEEPLQYTPNYMARNMILTITATSSRCDGNDDEEEALQEFDDSNFKTAYHAVWERAILERIKRDEKLPFETVRRLAERGHAKAQCLKDYAFRRGTEASAVQNGHMAKMWYRQAAENGHVSAQYSLGCFHHIGIGTELPSKALAAHWWRMAAEKGHTNAQYHLGRLHCHGKIGTELPSEALAAHWWHKAAEKGETKAQYDLGCLYYSGSGVQQSHSSAAHWWRKAAEKGHTNAQYNLGCLYGRGTGVQQSHSSAAHWLSKAAEQGLARAQYNLDVIHRKGT